MYLIIHEDGTLEQTQKISNELAQSCADGLVQIVESEEDVFYEFMDFQKIKQVE